MKTRGTLLLTTLLTLSAGLACGVSGDATDALAPATASASITTDDMIPVGTTCAGDVTIQRADEIADLYGCAVLNGSLSIQAPDLIDLSGLEYLTFIHGDLFIGADVDAPIWADSGQYLVGAVNLESLEGLDSLRRVDGSFTIGVVGDLPPMPASVQSIRIGPLSLPNLVGMHSLESVGELRIVATHMGPDLSPAFADRIVTALPTNFAALSGVTVKERLAIEMTDDAAFEDIVEHLGPTSMPPVKLAEGATVLIDNARIEDLGHIRWPRDLGALVVKHANVSSLAPLSKVTTVGDLTLEDNAWLTSLAGLENVIAIDRLRVIGGNHLRTLDGLAPELAVNAIEVAGMGLDDLGALQAVTGSLDELVVRDAPRLERLEGLEGVTSVGVLEIRDTGVRDLADLSGLMWTGDLVIQRNPNLTSLDGLASLDAVKENVVIEGNTQLAVCTADNAMERIGGVMGEGNMINVMCTKDGDFPMRCAQPMTGLHWPEDDEDTMCTRSIYFSEPNRVELEMEDLYIVDHLEIAPFYWGNSPKALEIARFPNLTYAATVSVRWAPSLITLDLSGLKAAHVEVLCDRESDWVAATPLRHLDLSSLERGSVKIENCTALPRCTMANMLSHLDDVQLIGLDESCVCGPNGAMMKGSCDLH